jgi:predicted O-linked N-acetylglucosamine transferase (SPINDLY family)
MKSGSDMSNPVSAQPVNRNAPCGCGSGRKYKHCCGGTRWNRSSTSAVDCYEEGNQQMNAGRVDQAIERYRRAITLKPAFYQAHSNLGVALENRGMLLEALDSYWAAVSASRHNPQAAGTYVNYMVCLCRHQRELFEMLRSDERAPQEVLARHRACARLLEAHNKPARRAHTNLPDPERRLRIGYVSPDFRMHSVAYFIEPVIARHNRSEVEVFCYHNCPLSDAVTERIQRFADQWLTCSKLCDDNFAARIRADGIDILVDLAGHTNGNRILTFAQKPAPIQIAYLGYPHPTGLAAMDYLLTDALADPGGNADTRRSERTLHLAPSMLVYRTAFGSGGLLAQAGPAVAPAPLLRSGYVTFGCFNARSKISDSTVGVWARVLAAAPGSRLLLKASGLDEAAERNALLGRFAQHGIGPERLMLEGRIDELAAHLARYAEVDVALDTFPYNGVTTSVEAVWMGVPFVTLAGTTLASRMGVSIATNLGHPEWIAHAPQEYVQKAVALTRNPAELERQRQLLRCELEASVLMDADRFTRGLETVYRAVWRRWCAAQARRA